MPGFDHFDLLAPLYDRVMRQADARGLAAQANLPTAGRLLDIGGGTGRVARALAGMAAEIVVADASLPMLSRAASHPGLDPVATPAERLPFDDACFDRVVMVDAFHHLQNQSLSLDEMWRVLAPGGRLVIEEPDIRRFGVQLVALAEKLLLMRSHFVTAEHVAAALSERGAQAQVTRDGAAAWVVAVKLQPSG